MNSNYLFTYFLSDCRIKLDINPIIIYDKIEESEVWKLKNFIIRNLNIYDLPQIIQARIAQENENGNGASNEYINAYESSLRLLFDKNNIIGYGAFFNNELISLGCFNLINLGYKKQIPYLCGVWTNPRYRGKA